MHTIMLMNSKGGCGKTTLATNIAAWFADEGAKVSLADFDPQGSSLDWLKARQDYEGIPEIHGIDATETPVTPAKGSDFLIMDAPAAVHGKNISPMLSRVHTLVIPVLPSPIDIRAATRFIEELLTAGQVRRHRTRLAVVANRVRENTVIYHQLKRFLGSLSIPFLGSLRESQNYIRAAERGLGLFELAPSQVYHDVVMWDPILEWLSHDERAAQGLKKRSAK